MISKMRSPPIHIDTEDNHIQDKDKDKVKEKEKNKDKDKKTRMMSSGWQDLAGFRRGQKWP